MYIVDKIDDYVSEENLTESTRKQLNVFGEDYVKTLKSITSVKDAQDARWDYIGKYIEAKIKALGVDEKVFEKLASWGLRSPPKSTSKKLKKLSSKWNAFQRQAEKEAMKIQTELGLSGKF